MQHYNGRGSSPFDAIRREDAAGEYWDGRDLMPLMDYAQWVKFEEVIKKAKASLALVQGADQAEHHFPIQESDGGRWGNQKIISYRLTRFGSYLTAMAGDDTKDAVAHARVYFAVKAREAEVAQPKPLSLPSQAEALRGWADALDAQQAAEREAAHVKAKNLGLEARERELTTVVQEAKPKVDAFDQLMDSTGTFSFAEVAKMLPIPIGQNRLYDLLREKGLIRPGKREPYQQYVDRGYFTLVPFTYASGSGPVSTHTPRITPKGLEYIRRTVIGA
jgi:phage antirepressor YoqD-like protein